VTLNHAAFKIFVDFAGAMLATSGLPLRFLVAGMAIVLNKIEEGSIDD